MKKVIFFLILCFLPFNVFASERLSLTVSENQVELGEIFQVQLDIQFSETSEIPSISIPGIEFFDIFSESQSERVMQTNDTFERIWSLNLALRPKKEGNYEIGPVEIEIEGEKYSSETQSVIVGTGIVPEIEEDNEEKGVGEKYQDLKPLKQPSLSMLYLIIGGGIFIIVFYFLLLQMFSPQKEAIKSENNQTNIGEKYVKLLLSLEKKSGIIPEKEFFHKLHQLIRLYLKEKYQISQAETLTLEEISPFLIQYNSELLEQFQKSYFHEFDGRKTHDSTKEKIIQNYIDIIKHVQ